MDQMTGHQQMTVLMSGECCFRGPEDGERGVNLQLYIYICDTTIQTRSKASVPGLPGRQCRMNTTVKQTPREKVNMCNWRKAMLHVSAASKVAI